MNLPSESKQDSSFPKAAVSHKTTGNNLTLTFCLFCEQYLPRGDLSPQDEQTSQSTGGSLTYVLLNEPFVIALLYVIAEVSPRNQMASVEGACGQFLCNFRIALDKGKPKFMCYTSQVHLRFANP